MKRLVAVAGILGLAWACSREAKVRPVVSPSSLKEGSVSSQSLGFEYGCQGLGARLLSSSDLDGSPVRVQFDTTKAQDGVGHLAIYRAGERGSQELVGFISRFYTQADKSFTLSLSPSQVCGDHYQVDAGCGLIAPQGGAYRPSEFIMSWELGVRCSVGTPSPTPVPSITPTPRETPTPTSTPTPSPSATPMSTPSPRPTMTPSPSPTPTEPPKECYIPSGVPLLCSAPFGSPESECGAFGLAVIGKDDNLDDAFHRASRSADLAIVKDGRGPCPHGKTAYRTYKWVSTGDILWKPLGAGDISHITYCSCPSE